MRVQLEKSWLPSCSLILQFRLHKTQQDQIDPDGWIVLNLVVGLPLLMLTADKDTKFSLTERSTMMIPWAKPVSKRSKVLKIQENPSPLPQTTCLSSQLYSEGSHIKADCLWIPAVRLVNNHYPLGETDEIGRAHV